MEYQDFSKNELIDEVRKLTRELEEFRSVVFAIQSGEIDAVAVHRKTGEQIYVLEDANFTYLIMIEEMNEGAVSFNQDHEVLFSNKSFARLTGYPITDVISKPVTNFVNKKFHWLFQDLTGDLTGPLKKSIKLLNSSGEDIPVYICVNKISMAGMDISFMTVTDEREKLHIRELSLHQLALEKITVRLRKAKEEAEQAVRLLREKNMAYSILNQEYIAINNKLAKANEELLLAKEEAEKSDRLKSAFIANMSHEIRTPLNSILGYTDMLMESTSDKERKKHVDVIIHSGRYLLHLIDDIIDLSRIEAEEMKLFESPVFINELLNKIKDNFDAFAVNKGKKHINFSLLHPGGKRGNLVIYTDEYRVQQIISNLLSNAFRFTTKGSIEFGYEILNQKEIMFFVRDTGSGIKVEDHEIIFNRFQQGKSTSKQVIAGTGLGLTISRGLTELLGGKIWLESEPKQGSTFYFTIPFNEAQAEIIDEPEKKTNESPGVPQLQGKIILVSEDDFYCRELLVYLLEKTGAKLIIAKDGSEAINKFNKFDVDLVLLDLRLPQKDGYEVLKEIRSKNPDIVVVAQTAYAMLDDIKKIQEAGFNDYLTKPISDNDLYRVLGRNI